MGVNPGRAFDMGEQSRQATASGFYRDTKTRYDAQDAVTLSPAQRALTYKPLFQTRGVYSATDALTTTLSYNPVATQGLYATRPYDQSTLTKRQEEELANLLSEQSTWRRAS